MAKIPRLETAIENTKVTPIYKSVLSGSSEYKFLKVDIKKLKNNKIKPVRKRFKKKNTLIKRSPKGVDEIIF
ncbi:MAG: hypothetical protein WCO12_02960 [bacterium]